MKTKLFIALAFVAMAFAACQKFDDSALWDAIHKQDARITALENATADLASWQTILSNLQQSVTVSDVYQNREDGSWTIKFSNGEEANIKDGAKGDKGDKGDQGDQGEQGIQGDPGADGATPSFKIEDETWYVSYDGSNWTALGSAIDNSLFANAFVQDGKLYITLADGTTVKFDIESMSGLAQILTAKATAGEYVVEGTIDGASIEFACAPKAYEAMTAATVEITISDCATTEFDATATYNLQEGIKVSVLAEDGVTTTEYELKAVVAEAGISMVWEKSDIEMGLANASSGVIAFCAKDKFVVASGKVYDLEGAYVGELNKTGISGALNTLSNDVNGVLVAYEQGNPMNVWAWYDGYDQAPTYLFNVGADYSQYGSITGDFNTGVVMSWRAAVSGAQTFQTVLYKKGDAEFNSWAILETKQPGNDGNWGTMASACNYDENKWGAVTFGIWDSFGGGAKVYTTIGTRNDNEVVAITNDLPGNGWGNYTTGSIRGFQWNGLNCIAACTTGWPACYLTIVNADNGEIIYGSETYSYASGSHSELPQAAYVYDEAKECGYLVMGVAANAAGGTSGVILTKLGY